MVKRADALERRKMAWYHVNSCCCPVGCCDCRVEYVYYNPWRNRFEIVLGRNQNLVPDFWEYLGELNGRYEERVFEGLKNGKVPLKGWKK